MDNLLEALKTGSAFSVNREKRDGKRRTPRAAGGTWYSLTVVVCLSHSLTVVVCLSHSLTVVVCLSHSLTVVVCLSHSLTVVVCFTLSNTTRVLTDSSSLSLA